MRRKTSPEKQREYDKRHSLKHPEKTKAQSARYHQLHKQEINERHRVYRLTHHAEILQKDREKKARFSSEHPGYQAMKSRMFRERHPEYSKQKDREYRKSRPEMFKEKARKRYQNEREAIIMRSLTRQMLKHNSIAKTTRSKMYVGCSAGFLRNHLESLFQPGMSWDNWGKWHVDHIVPLSWFPLKQDPSLIYVASHWTNLQPMWGKDNRKKGNRFAGNLGGVSERLEGME